MGAPVCAARAYKLQRWRIFARALLLATQTSLRRRQKRAAWRCLPYLWVAVFGRAVGMTLGLWKDNLAVLPRLPAYFYTLRVLRRLSLLYIITVSAAISYGAGAFSGGRSVSVSNFSLLSRWHGGRQG